MILEWLLGIGVTIGDWFASLFPDVEVPPFLTGLDSMLNDLFAQLGGVSVWADWGFIFVVVGVVVVVWGIAFTIKIVRAIASYLPFIGGAG
ncbi:MAG: hypothetical protein PSU94_18280 [Lacunisphaera sp.]|nr:hypothetical protein [Lacunisphaera sp.]